VLQHKSAYWALKNKGFSGLIVHLTTRIFGEAHFLRPASSIDFKSLKMDQFISLQTLIGSLLPHVDVDEIKSKLAESEEFLKAQEVRGSGSLEFPDRWNSGIHLQLLLFAFVRLAKPEIVVETGTANGASANAIAGALKKNNFGKLITFDIEKSGAPLVADGLRSWIEFVQTDGSDTFLKNYMSQMMPKSEPTLFLHDADHSYLGQIKDYHAAKELSFSYIFSDDVDTSLAFCDFAGSSGKVFFDAPKFIGCLVNKEISK
jgi:hypothetical protein